MLDGMRSEKDWPLWGVTGMGRRWRIHDPLATMTELGE